MPPKSAKKIIVREKEEVEEPMEVEPTASTSKADQSAKTPNSKKNEQPKLTSFFGKNAKNDAKQAKSPKNEPASPEKNSRKSTGGKKEEKKIKKVVKREPKEEDGDEEEKSVGEENVYEVEAVLSHSWTNEGVLMYKVSWVGYEGEDTEEPESALESATLKVEEYLQKLPEKARVEFEGKTGRKIEVPSKGAKKRPISETLPSSSKKEPKDRKIKKEEKEDEKKDEEKKGANKKALKESKKDNAKATDRRSKSSAVVKKEKPETLEQKLAVMKETAKKGFELSREDSIGGVVHSAAEAMITMLETDLNPDRVAKAIETMKSKLDVSVKEDGRSGKKHADQSYRDAIYKITRAFEDCMTHFIAQERREIAAEVKKEEADAEGLGALSTMGSVSGVEVKVEEEAN